MATMAMPIRAPSSTQMLPPTCALMPTPTPMPILVLKCSSESGMKEITTIFRGISSISLASIVQIISQAAMPQHALQQPTMMVTSLAELRATTHISHVPEAKQCTEPTNVSLDRPLGNGRGNARYVVVQRFLHL